jgi:DNA polymerase-1
LVLDMNETTLLLVDGSSFLYRAFHAMPDMRSPANTPTGAVFGMVGMLRRLRSDPQQGQGARLGAVIFDAPGKTFRDEWYPEYKANRASMPDDLRAQVPLIYELTKHLGWPLLVVEGIEADDVIGTLAGRAKALGMNTIVATGDKDLAQLVDERTVLINTMTRDGKSIERLDEAGVVAKFGVRPDQIVDYLTLVGDTVDNVPGVDKVGPKTAVKWLAQYGSLDQLITKSNEVSGAVGENLRKALDWLPTGRRLVTVKTDCDLSREVPDLEDSLLLKDEDPQALKTLFEQAGFRTWLKDINERLGLAATDGATVSGARAQGPVSHAPAAQVVAPLASDPPLHECVTTAEQLAAWIERIKAADLVAVDTETTSLDAMQAELVGISLSIEPGIGAYIPVAHRYQGAPDQLERESVLAALKPWFEDPHARKVGQHLKYDMHVLQNYGIRLQGVAHDTLLQSYVLEAHRPHDMDSLALRHLNRQTITFEEVAGKGAHQIGFDQVALDVATRYAAEDAEVTMQLHRTLYPRIEAEPGLKDVYERIEVPSAVVLQRMERTGVLIDAQALAKQSQDLGLRLQALEAQAHELAGQPFNLASPKQLGELLFEKQKLPVVKKTASGAPSTDEEVLSKLAEDYPLPKLLLEHRSLAKLKGTYTDKLPRMIHPRTGRVHTSYAQAVAVTGRLASNDPNLQNIPIRTAEGRRVREAFVAPEGWRILSADYSQIELRIMAHISSDAGLLKAFSQGLDVHRATASEIFGIGLEEVSSEQRRYAKTINFGLIYGMSAFGLASSLNIERDAAKTYIERYFARYPGVASYMERTRKLAHEQGYVETVFGRRLWLPEINSPNGPRRQGAERAAINAPMQGTAADIIKLAMVAVDQWIQSEQPQVRLVMQVHDELVLEVQQDQIEEVSQQLTRIMMGVAALQVPLEVGVGSGLNWDAAH